MSERKSFWKSLPGILTGIAAVIGAIAALYSAGVFESSKPASIDVLPVKANIEPGKKITLSVNLKDKSGEVLQI